MIAGSHSRGDLNTPPAESSTRATPLGWEALVVLAGFGAIFLTLHSNNLLAVDGNYRSLEVWRRDSLFFHANGHLLYPVNVLLWTRLLHALGLPLKSPFQFFAAVDWMNGLAGVVSLTLFYLLLRCVTESRPVSLIATSAFGLSNCFIAQAVNGNEPMVGFALAMLAFYVAIRSRRPGSSALLLLLLSGVLFAVSMATYRSMVLLAPAALLVVWFSRPRRRLAGAVALMLGGLLGTLAIYGPAYWLEGKHSLSAVFSAFLTEEGARGFLSLTPGKLLELPIGMANSLFPLLRFQPFNGIRGILHGGLGSLFTLGILPLVLCAFLLACLLATGRLWARMDPRQRLALTAAATGFAFTWVPAIFWDPTYTKLLIEPLACLTFICAVGMSVALRRENARFLWWAGALAWLAIACTSLPAVVNDHRRGTPWLSSTARLAAIVRPNDLVVGSWDPVSTLYSSLWADQLPDPSRRYVSVWQRNSQFYSFPSEALFHGQAAMATLNSAIARTQQSGGRVYFVGLLDLSRQDWDATLGRRFGVPYESLAAYRSRSKIVLELSENGRVDPVRVLATR